MSRLSHSSQQAGLVCHCLSPSDISMALHLDQLHNVQISLYWGPSSSDKPHQCLAEGKDHLPHPQPAASALPGAAPAAVGL